MKTKLKASELDTRWQLVEGKKRHKICELAKTTKAVEVRLADTFEVRTYDHDQIIDVELVD